MKIILYLFFIIHLSTCRDFYLGMFRKNDLLMSQDTVYKDRVPFRTTYTTYGRTYKCPITYVRVIDRLNIGRGPIIKIIRGGLKKNYIVLRFTSTYNHPLSVTVFVGCENKKLTNPPWKIIRTTKSTTTATTKMNNTSTDQNSTDKNSTDQNSTISTISTTNEDLVTSSAVTNSSETTTAINVETTTDTAENKSVLRTRKRDIYKEADYFEVPNLLK